MSDNREQVEFWNGPGGDRWVSHQEDLDRVLEPFGRAALDAAQVKAGQRIIDVGCGCGWTTLALADAVGARGAVLGVDVSEPMLARARQRAAARALGNVSFALADASTHRFEGEAGFDVLLSRFGVMFFRDPTAAFANLRRALRPGGRTAFVCWGPKADNPWFTVPMVAAGTVVPLPEPTPPEDPGPFSLADDARVRRILEGAGFTRLSIERISPPFVLGPDLESAATHAVETGPVSRLLHEVDAATRARTRAAILAALAPHAGADGVALASCAWVVRASVRS